MTDTHIPDPVLDEGIRDIFRKAGSALASIPDRALNVLGDPAADERLKIRALHNAFLDGWERHRAGGATPTLKSLSHMLAHRFGVTIDLADLLKTGGGGSDASADTSAEPDAPPPAAATPSSPASPTAPASPTVATGAKPSDPSRLAALRAKHGKTGMAGPSKLSTAAHSYQDGTMRQVHDLIKAPSVNQKQVMALTAELIKHARDYGGSEKERVKQWLTALKKSDFAVSKVPALSRIPLPEARVVIDFAIYLVETDAKTKKSLKEGYATFFAEDVGSKTLTRQQISQILKTAAQVVLRNNPNFVTGRNAFSKKTDDDHDHRRDFHHNPTATPKNNLKIQIDAGLDDMKDIRNETREEAGRLVAAAATVDELKKSLATATDPKLPVLFLKTGIAAITATKSLDPSHPDGAKVVRHLAPETRKKVAAFVNDNRFDGFEKALASDAAMQDLVREVGMAASLHLKGK